MKATNSEDLFTLYKADPNYYIHKEGNSLYVWDLIDMEDQGVEGFRSSEVTFDEHPLVFNKLIEMAIVQLFRDNSYDIYKRRYSSIWEVAIRREQERVFGAVSLRPVLAFSVRNLYSKRGKKQVIALTIRRRYKPVFIGGEDEIQNELADTRGLTRNDNGKIVASSHNVKRYLEATGQSESYRKFLDDKHSGQREYDFLTETAERFNTIAPRLRLPGELKISDFLLVNLPNESFQSVRIPKPRYYFYNERSETGYYNKVVSKLRPYSYDLLNGKNIPILVLTPEEYEGSVGEYIVKLERKLKELFHLGQMNFIIETITPPDTYSDVINRLDPREYTLAIIVVSQQDKILPIEILANVVDEEF